jgi:DNA-binding transcriptional regulator YiaG
VIEKFKRRGEQQMTNKEFKAIRKVMDWTQPVMAEVLNVSLSHVNKSENGNYGLSAKMECKVKEALEKLGLTIEEVLKEARRSGLL